MTGEHKTVDTSDNTDNTSENNDKDYEVSKTGDERAESPDSVKMTSSSETEADSAMSQVTQNILSKLSRRDCNIVNTGCFITTIFSKTLIMQFIFTKFHHLKSLHCSSSLTKVDQLYLSLINCLLHQSKLKVIST